MENKLAGVVDQTVIETETVDTKMYSCENDVANKMCSSQSHDTCGDGCSSVPTKTE
nr:hypothetical protein [uncultured Anaerosporobacter sp.]